jgi:hypothetical protein
MRLHRLVIALVTSTSLFAASAKNSPMLSVLPQFTAANVPALGPGEQPADQTWDAPTEAPPNRPGHDIAEHPMLYAGEGYNNLLLVSGGKVIWNYFTGPHGELDDAWLMSMARILYSRQYAIEEVTPQKQIVWHYDAPPVPRSTPASPSASTKFSSSRTACRRS